MDDELNEDSNAQDQIQQSNNNSNIAQLAENAMQMIDQQLFQLYTRKRAIQRSLYILGKKIQINQQIYMPIGRVGFISTKIASEKVLTQLSSEYVAELNQDKAISKLQTSLNNIKQQISQYKDLYYNKNFMSLQEIQEYKSKFAQDLQTIYRPAFPDTKSGPEIQLTNKLVDQYRPKKNRISKFGINMMGSKQ